MNYAQQYWQIFSGMYDGLVTFKREGGSAYFIMNGDVVVGTIVRSNHCWCAQVLWGGPGGDMVFSHQSIDQVTGSTGLELWVPVDNAVERLRPAKRIRGPRPDAKLAEVRIRMVTDQIENVLA